MCKVELLGELRRGTVGAVTEGHGGGWIENQ